MKTKILIAACFFSLFAVNLAYGRWPTVDPRAEKYYPQSPYAYCNSNPIKYIDPNGDTTRVYIETNSFGHVWISTGEGANKTVYSYGRYAGTNGEKSFSSIDNGPGVLLRLTGKDAEKFNQETFDKNGGVVYNILDAPDAEVAQFFDDQFNMSSAVPDKGKYTGSENARIIDEYSLLENNCTTKVGDALNRVGSNALTERISTGGTYQRRIITPDAMEGHFRMRYNSVQYPSVYKSIFSRSGVFPKK